MAKVVQELRERPVVAIAIAASLFVATAVVFGLQATGSADAPDQRVSNPGHFQPTIVIQEH